MAMNLSNPTAQTLVFPGSSAYTNSIYLSGMYEVVGVFIDQLPANAAILRVQTSRSSLATADASATFNDALDKDYSAIDLTATGTEMEDGVTHVHFSPETFIIGPVRFRFSLLQSDGSTAVNGAADDTIYPVFRQI